MNEEELSIWSEHLTENEEKLIQDAIESDNIISLRRWTSHLLKMAIAQRELVNENSHIRR